MLSIFHIICNQQEAAESPLQQSQPTTIKKTHHTLFSILVQSSNPNSSINSNLNSSTFENGQSNQSRLSSSKSSPKKRIRRSTSIKGKMSELSKRVSKIR